MENKNNELTVWQRLTQAFGPNSLLGQDVPTYKFDKKELLRTKDRNEYEKELLQSQQTLYLANQWQKIESNLYTQAIYYEPTRLAAFYDYESMEFTPEISTALDIYAEESTTPDENGHILQIYSESKRIKGILADLFNNTLDINTNLQMWIRNTCKYGDNFVYLKLDPEKGIIGCVQLPNIEIERLEKGMSPKRPNTEVKPDEKGVRFNWKEKNMEFNTWEVAHFRLLGDDRKLPYGTSMLEKARRIWKQLVLAEDAMLIYRTSRAPERRVFKVFVGNMDDKDVAMPIETLAGAQNLSEIADIEYIQKKLVTAIRVPKAYLGFEEPVGDGKNLSLLDIRFARTINKIQKNMLSELNKIAIIHLFLLGFEDELTNFTLGLTNPSKQADLLMVEVWKEKVLLYKDLVTDIQGTIAPTSATWAKKHIFGWSDEDIKLDIQRQRMEKAVAAELVNTPTIITHTGLFDNIDNLYKTVSGVTDSTAAAPAEGGGMDMGGDLGGPPPPPGPPPGGPEGGLPESKAKMENLLLENIDNEILIGNNSLGEIEKELMKILDK